MADGGRESWQQEALRDVGVTVLLGPLRYLVPVIAYVLLYPLILTKSGPKVLGTWSLLGAVSSFLTVADVGFSTLLTREAGRDRLQEDLEGTRLDHRAAGRCYWALLVGLLLGFNLLSRPLLSGLQETYSLAALTASINVLLIGTIVQLIGKLDAAILAARSDNSTVQAVAIVAPAFFFSTAVLGAYASRPIEGLAAGTVLSGISMVMGYRWRLARKHAEWHSVRVSLPLRETFSRIANLTRRGWHLYTISIGMLLREPLLRFALVFSLGLTAVATYDIAMRVTRSARDVIAAGFNVLYPSFAFFHRVRDRAHTIRLAQLSLIVLIPLGAAALGLLIGAADFIFNIWLGEVPQHLTGATQILAVWNLITIANIPFWFLLQATHNERAASLSLWAHTTCVLLLFPLAEVVDFTLGGVLVYWTITAVLTQILIYASVHMRLGLLWPIVLNPRLLLLVGCSLLFVLLSFPLQIGPQQLTLSSVPGIALALVAYVPVAATIAAPPVLAFVRSSWGLK